MDQEPVKTALELKRKLARDRAKALNAEHQKMMSAANARQLAEWRKAVARGWLSGTEKRQWIGTPDARICPVCKALDGETVTLDAPFSNGKMRPPGCRSCRCTMGLVS
jgi:hypothetical protein